MKEIEIMEELLRVARGIRNPYHRAEALLGIGEALTEIGKSEEARGILREAWAYSTASENGILKYWQLSRAVALMLRAGEKEGIEHLMQEISEVVRKMDEDDFGDFINVCCYAIDICEIFKDIFSHLKGKTRSEIAKATAKGLKECFLAMVDIAPLVRESGDENWDWWTWRGTVNEVTKFVIDILGVEEGKEMAKEISDEDTLSHIYGAMAVKLAEARKYEEAIEIVEQKELFVEDIPEAMIAISLSMAKSGDRENAISMLEQLRAAIREWYNEDSYELIEKLRAVADAMIKIGELGKAVEILNEIEELVGSEGRHSFGAEMAKLIAIRLRMGDKAEAERTLGEALRAIKRMERTYERKEKIKDIAKMMVNELGENEVLNFARSCEQPEGKAWLLWGMAQVMAEKRINALQVLKEAQAWARGIKDDWERSQILALIAETIAEEGDLEEALWTARNVDDELERARVLLLVASLLHSKGEREKAGKLSEEALFIIDRPELKEFSDELLARLAPALARGEKLTRAVETARKIGDIYYRAKALSEVASALGEIGKDKEAQQLLEEVYVLAGSIDKSDLRREILCDIALLRAKVGDIEGSLNIILSEKISSHEIWEEVMKTVINRRGIEEAEKVARSIPFPKVRAEAFIQIFNALKEVGDEEGAKRFEEEILYSLLEYYRTRETPTDVIEELPRENGKIRIARGVAIINELFKEEWEPGTRGSVTTEYTIDYPELYSALEPYIVATGNIERALNRLESELTEEGEKAKAIIALVRLVAKKLSDRALGVFSEAIEVAQTMEDTFLRENALREIADSLIRVGNLDKAQNILEGIQDKRQRVELEVEMARARMAAKEEQKGMEIIEEALAEARTIANPWEQSQALSKIVEFLREIGNFEDAVKIASEIDNEDERNNALMEIATALAEEGNIEQALKLARGIEDKFYQVRALYNIAERLKGMQEA